MAEWLLPYGVAAISIGALHIVLHLRALQTMEQERYELENQIRAWGDSVRTDVRDTAERISNSNLQALRIVQGDLAKLRSYFN